MSEIVVQNEKFNITTIKKEKKSNALKVKRAKKIFITKKQKRKNFTTQNKTKNPSLVNTEKTALILDDISLGTNSTNTSIEEESDLNNKDMFKYIKDLQIVLEDMHNKGTKIKNFEKILEKTEGGGVKFPKDNLKNLISSLNLTEKINLVLDIDETLLYSTLVKIINKKDANENLICEYKNSPSDDIFYIQLQSTEQIYIYKVQIRKNITEFFQKLTPYCNFYINTMANCYYTIEVLNILIKYYGLPLLNDGKKNIFCTSPKSRKNLPEEITKNENFLILDDNLCMWETDYIPSIIPIRKFRGLFNGQNETKNIFYQYYLFNNKIYGYDENKRPFCSNENKMPYATEIKSEENSQLFYLSEIIIKSFLLSKIVNIPIRHALNYIQNTILKEYNIYYDGFDKEFISAMIKLLGGTMSDKPEGANYILLEKNEDENKYIGKRILDTKFIFDCFFNYKV